MNACIGLIHFLSERATLSQTALAAGGLAQDGGTAGAQDDALQSYQVYHNRKNNKENQEDKIYE